LPRIISLNFANFGSRVFAGAISIPDLPEGKAGWQSRDGALSSVR
jgi:hypothetical protein